MTFTKARIVLVPVLSTLVVLCGIGLWMVESHLVNSYTGCGGTGSARAVPEVRTQDVGTGDRLVGRALKAECGGAGRSELGK